jgi:hypothetical protein
MCTKKMVLIIGRGTKMMLSTPPKSDEHKEKRAHQTWNKNDAINSTQL